MNSALIELPDGYRSERGADWADPLPFRNHARFGSAIVWPELSIRFLADTGWRAIAIPDGTLEIHANRWVSTIRPESRDPIMVEVAPPDGGR